MAKILIVEDEKPISDLIKMTVEMAEYETVCAFDGEEALNIINNENFDLAILDIMLPKIDGYTLLPHMKEKKIPVIMLTAKSNVIDKVRGLDMGAEDYMTKPFESLELIARIKVVLRRSKDNLNIINFDDITIDIKKHKAFKDGEEVILTAKEYDLLLLFLENEGLVLSRETLLQKIWDYDFLGNTRTVDMHVKNIRRKLSLSKIKTVYKVGYMFEK